MKATSTNMYFELLKAAKLLYQLARSTPLRQFWETLNHAVTGETQTTESDTIPQDLHDRVIPRRELRSSHRDIIR